MPTSTSDCRICRTAPTASTRNRALVSPGPTLIVIASGGSAPNRSSSVRSSPIARMVVAAKRSGAERRHDAALVHAVRPDLDDPVPREDLDRLVAQELVEMQAQLVGAARAGLLIGHPVVPRQRRRLHLDQRAGRALGDLPQHGQHRLPPAPAELTGRHPLAGRGVAREEPVLRVQPDRQVAEPFLEGFLRPAAHDVHLGVGPRGQRAQQARAPRRRAGRARAWA